LCSLLTLRRDLRSDGFITDQSANPGVRTIEVSADGGTVFITDSGDNTLYVVALGNPTMM